MNMVKLQAAFLLDACDLIVYANDIGFLVTGGELWRPPEMQQLYFERKQTKVRTSEHGRRMAIDLNFFTKDGVWVQDHETLKPLGDYWEAKSPEHRWGGSWRGLIEAGHSTFVDTPHFERRL